MHKETENKLKTQSERSTPQELSDQLGVPVVDVFGAIEAAKIQSHESEQGRIEYDVQPVISAVIEQKRLREETESRNFRHYLNESLELYRDSLREMIREENKTAYQIKQMTESRFLEVLGQLSISLGRVEAFLAQSSRILNQIDLRLARSADPLVKELVTEIRDANEKSASVVQASITVIGSHNPSKEDLNVLPETLTYNDHWVAFEVYLTSIFATDALLSESARTEWFLQVRRVIGMGSLELRLNGEPLLSEIRPALLNHFSQIIAGMPEEKDVLPSFEKYLAWVSQCLQQGYPAILTYLLLVQNCGAQISWSGFLSTFVSEG